MKISSKSWKSYIERLSRIDQKAAKSFADWFREHPDAEIDDLLNYAYYTSDYYGNAASELACEMYDEVAVASGKTLPPAEPARTATYGEVAKAIQGKLLETQDPDAVGSVVGTKVKTVGLDTLLNNSLRDGAEFAWIPSGDTCAYCIMLASNGWQRASKKALKNGHASHVHNNCNCTYAIRFDENTEVEGYDPEYYLDIYDNAEGYNWQDKVNSMRRANYAKNKDKINAQKRVAYANREELKAIEKIKNSGIKLFNNESKNGIINIEIDELVPCLRDNKTGELVETTIGAITDRSILKKYNQKNGWYIDWSKVPKDKTILALRVKGKDEIQGIVAFEGMPDHKTVRGYWAVANPKSNPKLTDSKEYNGIGGHLFAAMAEASKQMGFEGFVEGKAANIKLLNHYIKTFGATPISGYEFFIDDISAEKLIEKYTWEKV